MLNQKTVLKCSIVSGNFLQSPKVTGKFTVLLTIFQAINLKIGYILIQNVFDEIKTKNPHFLSFQGLF